MKKSNTKKRKFKKVSDTTSKPVPVAEVLEKMIIYFKVNASDPKVGTLEDY